MFVFLEVKMNNNFSNDRKNQAKSNTSNSNKNNYRGNNRFNKFNSNKANTHNTPPLSDVAVISHSMKTNSNSNKNFNPNYRPRRNNYRGKPEKHFTLDKVYTRYNYLLELHNLARKKYFENIYQSNERIVYKLKNTYEQTLLDIQTFLKELTDPQKEYLNEKLNIYPEDTTYSTNHDLNKKGEKPIDDYQVKDPHFLSSQRETDYSTDTQESVGTLEEYNQVKQF